MTEFCEIEKLVALFNHKTEDSDSEEEILNHNKANAIKPSDLGVRNAAPKTKTKSANPYSKIEPPKEKRREILDPEDCDDFPFDDRETSKADWKDTPQWDICYKQQVTASDVYLQMGFKNPSSASCEDIIITIYLPDEQRQNMDLKILKDRLTLVSPRFYLDLPLPHPVDPQKGNAQWDKESSKLAITLSMDRELDLLNF